MIDAENQNTMWHEKPLVALRSTRRELNFAGMGARYSDAIVREKPTHIEMDQLNKTQGRPAQCRAVLGLPRAGQTKTREYENGIAN
jgi:hypothetical protein